MQLIKDSKFRYVLAMLALIFLQACATGPYDKESKAASDLLLNQQLASLKKTDETQPPKLFIVAAALHDQSKAFRGDVDGLVSRMSLLHKSIVAVRLANPTLGQKADLPYATRENLGLAVDRVAAVMRPVDRAVVMVTTHGNVDMLAINASARQYPNISGQQLHRMLKPLEPFNHGVILSACYSGSLIAPLSQGNRWILTAAAADRISFGCQFNGLQTYYIKALLDQNINSSTTLTQWHERASRDVAERELREKLSPPSNPQFSLGKNYASDVSLANLLGL